MPDETDKAPEVDSLRYLCKPGAKSGTLSLVVGGVHYLYPCKIVRGMFFVEDLVAAVRKREE